MSIDAVTFMTGFAMHILVSEIENCQGIVFVISMSKNSHSFSFLGIKVEATLVINDKVRA